MEANPFWFSTQRTPLERPVYCFSLQEIVKQEQLSILNILRKHLDKTG